MRVRLLANHISPKGVFKPPTIIDVPDAEAKELIAGGYAELPKAAKPKPPPPPEPEEDETPARTQLEPMVAPRSKPQS
jgi:hypothetical protein